MILNLFPYTNGHLMVAPFEHVGRLQDVEPEVTAEMIGLAQQAMRRIEEVYEPGGLQRRAQPGPGRRRRRRGPHPPARRPALGRRQQLHARPRRHAGDAAVAGGELRRPRRRLRLSERRRPRRRTGLGPAADLQGLRRPRPLRRRDGRRHRLPARPRLRPRPRRSPWQDGRGSAGRRRPRHAAAGAGDGRTRSRRARSPRALTSSTPGWSAPRCSISWSAPASSTAAR